MKPKSEKHKNYSKNKGKGKEMKKIKVDQESKRKEVPEETKPLLKEFKDNQTEIVKRIEDLKKTDPEADNSEIREELITLFKEFINKSEIRHELFELLDLDEKHNQSKGLSQLEFMLLVAYQNKDNDDGKYLPNFTNTADLFKACAKADKNKKNVSEEEFKTCTIQNNTTAKSIQKNLHELSKQANETVGEKVTCTDGLTAAGIENLFKSENILMHSFEKADKGIDCGQIVEQADGNLTKKEFRRFMQFPAMKNMQFLTADKNQNGKINKTEYIKLQPGNDEDAETFFKEQAGDDNQMDIKEFQDACFQQNFTDKIFEANDKTKLSDSKGNDQHGDQANDGKLSYQEIEKFVRRTT